MKTLKTTLFLTYAVLIVLLLLSNMKSCKSNTRAKLDHMEEEQYDEPVTEDIIPDEELIDDALHSGEYGDLKVTLLWDFLADIDLHVIQPNGEEINFQHNHDATTGGALDVDNRTGGEDSAENIYWENPPNGEYTVYLHYYGNGERGDDAPTYAGTCHVIVFIKGQEPRTFNVRMSEPEERKQVVKFTI